MMIDQNWMDVRTSVRPSTRLDELSVCPYLVPHLSLSLSVSLSLCLYLF